MCHLESVSGIGNILEIESGPQSVKKFVNIAADDGPGESARYITEVPCFKKINKYSSGLKLS